MRPSTAGKDSFYGQTSKIGFSLHFMDFLRGEGSYNFNMNVVLNLTRKYM